MISKKKKETYHDNSSVMQGKKAKKENQQPTAEERAGSQQYEMEYRIRTGIDKAFYEAHDWLAEWIKRDGNNFFFFFKYSLLVCGPEVGYDEPGPSGHPDCNTTMYNFSWSS